MFLAHCTAVLRSKSKTSARCGTVSKEKKEKKDKADREKKSEGKGKKAKKETKKGNHYIHRW